MTHTNRIAFVNLEAVVQPAAKHTPPLAPLVLPSLEALRVAGYTLVLLAPNSPSTEEVLALLRSQGLAIDHVPADAASAPVHIASFAEASELTLTDCLWVVTDTAPGDWAGGPRTVHLNNAASATAWQQLVVDVTARRAAVDRKTKETAITGRVDLDAIGPIRIATGIGFFDHMLEQLAKHGGFALELRCEGDLHIDEHHTIEDCALALGEAMRRALGDKRGIGRYGFLLPMDEAQARVAIDLSGRAFAVFEGHFGRESVGGLPTELVPHFFRSLAESLGAAIHVHVQGENTHHMIEACFKGVGRALRQAIRREGDDLPTTKGVL
jgi:imidazoleglycerol phosphate dehydratase HisB